MSTSKETLMQELQRKLEARKALQPLLTEAEQSQIVSYLEQVKKTFNLRSILNFFSNGKNGAQYGRLFFHDSEMDLSQALTRQFGSNKFLLENLKEKIRQVPEKYSSDNYIFIWNQILLPYLNELESNRLWQSFWQEESRILNVNKIHKAKKQVVSALTFKLFSELSRQSVEVLECAGRSTFVKLANCLDYNEISIEMRGTLCAEVLAGIQIAENEKNSSQLKHKFLLKKIKSDVRSSALTEEEIYLVIIEGVAKACLDNSVHFKLLTKSIDKARKKFPAESLSEGIKTIFGQLHIKNVPEKYERKLKEFYEVQDERKKLLKTLSLPQLSQLPAALYYSDTKKEDPETSDFKKIAPK